MWETVKSIIIIILCGIANFIIIIILVLSELGLEKFIIINLLLNKSIIAT